MSEHGKKWRDMTQDEKIERLNRDLTILWVIVFSVLCAGVVLLLNGLFA